MNQDARQLYIQMRQDIALCKQKGMDCQTKCECCFQIAEKYWKLLKGRLKEYVFESITDEIEFFKHIKPLFIAEIEYYRLLLNTTHFRPEDNKIEEAKDYWLKQCNRLGKYISENIEICTYIKTGRTDKDTEWFVRVNNAGNKVVCAADPTVTSSHDLLVGQFLAFEKYSNYADEKFKELVRRSANIS